MYSAYGARYGLRIQLSAQSLTRTTSHTAVLDCVHAALKESRHGDIDRARIRTGVRRSENENETDVGAKDVQPSPFSHFCNLVSLATLDILLELLDQIWCKGCFSGASVSLCLNDHRRHPFVRLPV